MTPVMPVTPATLVRDALAVLAVLEGETMTGAATSAVIPGHDRSLRRPVNGTRPVKLELVKLELVRPAWG